MLLINRTGRGVSQKERPPKVTTTKIRIVIRSFDHPFFENLFFAIIGVKQLGDAQLIFDRIKDKYASLLS